MERITNITPSKDYLAVFASYNISEEIEEYVIYYLEKLSQIADIIFIADSFHPEEQIARIKQYTIHTACMHHGEYDFGSYKRGFSWAKDNSLLPKYQHLILCNDSMYGPFYPFENIFAQMEAEECDFWGITYSTSNLNHPERNHLQSFFLVFDQKVYTSEAFVTFLHKVKREASKSDVVANYECTLSQTLIDAGFTLSSYLKDKPPMFFNNPLYNWDKIIKKGFPFLKRALLKNNVNKLRRLDSYKKLIPKYSDYPVHLITDNLAKYDLHPQVAFTDKANLKRIQRWIFSVILHQRYLIIKVFGKYFIIHRHK